MIAKKLPFIGFLYVVLPLLIFTSCSTKEELVLDSTKNLITKDSKVAELIIKMATNNISNFKVKLKSSDDTLPDCTTFKYPVTFNAYYGDNPSPKEIVVHSDEELLEFFNTTLTATNPYYIFFPVSLIDSEGNETVINSLEELETILQTRLDDCETNDDSDGDGVSDSDEDTDGDGDPTNDDTDGDGTPDYLDDDDDGDGIPTEDEDTNGDGDPTNDDTDGDGIPDYLDDDDDGDGIPTEDEDTDGDGDPTNDDTDGDGIPDYADDDSDEPDNNDEPEGCNTMFAKGDDTNSTCFINDGFNRWGWSIGPLEQGEYSFNIYGGAGQCDIDKGDFVGVLKVSYHNDTVEVTYEANDGFVFNETHLYVGSEAYPTKNGRPTVAPGQFPYKHEDLDEATSDSYTVTDMSGEAIYIIAHGTTCQDDTDS